MRRQVSPYGSWKSPVTSDIVAQSVVGLEQVEVEGEKVYWCEMRPSEAGRCVIVKNCSDGRTVDVNPPPFNARTTVHEYGGGAYKVKKGEVYFTNFVDQRLYKMKPGEKPKPITTKTELRYADFAFDDRRRRIICVREDHRERGKEASNTIVSMNLEGKALRVIASGNNFYSSPRISPDGKYLAWISWNHPNMPWDKTELWVGRLRKGGNVEEPIKVVGELEESVLQPSWSNEGVLYFVSDRSNWWNIYRWYDNEVKPVCPRDAEFAVPQWAFAQSNYDFESEHSIICSFTRKAEWQIARLDVETGSLETLETPYTHVSHLKVSNDCAFFLGGSPQEVRSVVKLDLETYETEVLKRSSEISIDEGYISKPKQIEFPMENGLTAYAIYYKPSNQDYVSPLGTLPPLLVFTHGGPTSVSSLTLSWAIQYWTSRGFAIVDVNYGGSTSYGRDYRQRLHGQWGVVDVDDCVNATKYLVDSGEVDGEKLAIRGGSAGGYTTLSALTFRDVFKAGASYYGVSDLEALAKETHKFESRYLDSLIGPYPERKDLYHNRSPINFLDRIRAPMILFQGLEDKVVPPNQAKLIVEALRKMGRPVAYLTFEHEQHGFRQAKNIKRSLEAELYFYSRIFGFEPAGPIESVKIENL
jgi:dipeptidyl aminopeptidase/acylaminoacyl peptidase